LELQEEARFAMVAALQMMSIGGMQLGKFTGVCCFQWKGSNKRNLMGWFVFNGMRTDIADYAENRNLPFGMLNVQFHNVPPGF